MPKDDKRGTPAATRPRRSGGGGCLTALVIVVVLLVVTGIVVSRTRGFLDLAAGRLSDQLGLKVTIGASHIGLPYDLVLDDVKATTPTGKRAVLEVRELRLGVRPPWKLMLLARGVVLQMAKSAGGEWEPSCAAWLNPTRGPDAVGEWFGGLGRLVTVDIREATIRWSEPGGGAMAAVEGLAFSARPLTVDERDLWYFRLDAQTVARPGGGTGRQVHREWFSTQGRPYMELDYRGTWGPGGTHLDFWGRAPAAGREERKQE